MIQHLKWITFFCGIVLVKGSPLIDNGFEIKNENSNIIDDSVNIDNSLLLKQIKRVKPTSWSDIAIDLAILKSIDSVHGDVVESTLRLSLPAHLTTPSPMNVGILGNNTLLTITSPIIESMNGVKATKKEAFGSTDPKSSDGLNGVYFDFGDVSTGDSNGLIDLGFKVLKFLNTDFDRFFAGKNCIWWTH